MPPPRSQSRMPSPQARCGTLSLPHAAVAASARLTCCSSRWEEAGLQLQHIPAALVAVVTSVLEPLGQPPASLWSVDPGSRRWRPVCAGEGVSPKNRLSPTQKEWQPLEASQGTATPFFSEASCRYSSVQVCVHTERGLALEVGQPPWQGVCPPCLPLVTTGALLVKKSSHSWHLCIQGTCSSLTMEPSPAGSGNSPGITPSSSASSFH